MRLGLQRIQFLCIELHECVGVVLQQALVDFVLTLVFVPSGDNLEQVKVVRVLFLHRFVQQHPLTKTFELYFLEKMGKTIKLELQNLIVLYFLLFNFGGSLFELHLNLFYDLRKHKVLSLVLKLEILSVNLLQDVPFDLQLGTKFLRIQRNRLVLVHHIYDVSVDVKHSACAFVAFGVSISFFKYCGLVDH